MAGYQHAGPAKGECYGIRPTSPGVPSIEQFHGMLKDAINRRPAGRWKAGMQSALAMYEGYFGYFGRKGEK